LRAPTDGTSFAPVPSAPFRLGSVPYLNAVPLTAGIEHGCVFLPPSRLAAELHAGRLDAALVSVVVQQRECIGGAAQLERSGMLVALALEPDFAAKELT